jgi:hypothetical protein
VNHRPRLGFYIENSISGLIEGPAPEGIVKALLQECERSVICLRQAALGPVKSEPGSKEVRRWKRFSMRVRFSAWSGMV